MSNQLPPEELNDQDLEDFRRPLNESNVAQHRALDTTSTTTSEVFRSRKLVPKRVQRDPIEQPLPPSPKEDTFGGLIFGAVMSISAGVTAFMIVATVVLAIIVPPWYRSLAPRYQAVWCNRVSLLCDLQEERDTEDIYALNSEQEAAAAAAAAAILSEPTETSTPTLAPTNTPEPTLPPATIVAADVVATTEIPPTATPIPTATSTPTPTPIPVPQFASLELDNLTWELQGWNNCGPTTITIGLTYFGYDDNQRRAASFLKPNSEDTNVSPEQLVDFVNTSGAGAEIGARALYRVGGTSELLKILVSNDFPVIIERGIQVEGEGWMGHYSLVVGYDTLASEYLLYDSFYGYSRGEGLRIDKDFIHTGWRQFNYTFVVIYDARRQGQLMTLLGDHADQSNAARIARDVALDEVRANPDDSWAWFNLGTSYTMLGDYEDAADAFDFWRTLSPPFRMLWYQFGPYIAYYQIGRYDDVLALALAAERTTPYVEEIYYYRGLVYAAQGNVNSAVFQFDRALQYNANFTPAEDAKQAVLQGRFSPPVAG